MLFVKRLTIKRVARTKKNMKKKARPVVLTVRLSEEEHRIFKAKAKKRGLTVASFIRTIGLGAP